MDINWALLLPLLLIQLTIQIIALIDLFKQKEMDKTKKIIWLVVILLLNILGPILYFAIERREK